MNEKCYWNHTERDMGATYGVCRLQYKMSNGEKFVKCNGYDRECEEYIANETADRIVKKAQEEIRKGEKK